jgi:hypothetical protein
VHSWAGRRSGTGLTDSDGSEREATKANFTDQKMHLARDKYHKRTITGLCETNMLAHQRRKRLLRSRLKYAEIKIVYDGFWQTAWHFSECEPGSKMKIPITKKPSTQVDNPIEKNATVEIDLLSVIVAR